MVAISINRVTANTADEINERIREQMEASVLKIAALGPGAIERRLSELDREWDIERCLETMAPSVTLAGIALGLTMSRKWFVFPVLVQSFLLQHAIQGWCPPLPILRRLGVRTAEEIDQERYALKALRGDFRNGEHSSGQADNETRARRALQAVKP